MGQGEGLYPPGAGVRYSASPCALLLGGGVGGHLAIENSIDRQNRRARSKSEQHFHDSQTGSFAGEVGHEVMVGGQRHRERRVLVDDAAALGLVLPSQHAVRLRGATEEQQVAGP